MIKISNYLPKVDIDKQMFDEIFRLLLFNCYNEMIDYEHRPTLRDFFSNLETYLHFKICSYLNDCYPAFTFTLKQSTCKNGFDLVFNNKHYYFIDKRRFLIKETLND